MGIDSWASSPHSAKVMRGNRSRDTKPELAVRRLLHAEGLRYRVNVRPLPSLRRTADIVLASKRIAVFIDGCYWHGCPEHYVASKSNRDYWDVKIETNAARDAQTNAALSDAGWTVLRYWSHDRPENIAASIQDSVRVFTRRDDAAR
ncbi:very short patch repair endonuclease [Yimella lutea]|nr:very short patch repair endonuclease [Yimella lutea]